MKGRRPCPVPLPHTLSVLVPPQLSLNIYICLSLYSHSSDCQVLCGFDFVFLLIKDDLFFFLMLHVRLGCSLF